MARADARIQLTGFQAVREALRARRRPLYRLIVRAGAERPGPELEELMGLAEAAGVPVERREPGQARRPRSGPGRPAPRREGGDGGLLHQGIGLEAGPLPEVALEALAGRAGEGPGGHATLVALDGVEDPQNLGAIARVADAAGAAGLILTRRRAPPLSTAVSRASAGAIEWIPTARVPNLVRGLEQLKRGGFWVFGADVEGAEDLFALSDRALRGPRVVVLGAEGRGLRPGVVRSLDHRVGIPMQGRVASLNVAAAAAVVLFELARRDRAATPP